MSDLDSITAQLQALTELVRELGKQQSAEWLPIQQAAKFASVSRDTLEAAIKSGELAASDVGTGKYRSYRISKTALTAWLESKAVRTAASVAKDAVMSKWFSKKSNRLSGSPQAS